MLRWQKELIDWYGYDNLVRWQASAGDEFSAQNAFERGKLAMNLDGEWRVAFVQSEHPELNFGTAPHPGRRRPARPLRVGLHEREHHRHPEDLRAQGRGLAAPQIPGHRHGRARQDDERDPQRADDHGRARSPDVKPDEAFNIFLDIFGNPNTRTTPITLVGSANQDLVDAFVTKYQAGKVDDLEGGLADLDQQIDAQLEAAGGAQVP